MKRALLLYQVSITNVVCLDGEPRRLFQHAYRPCEDFCRGLVAAGVREENKAVHGTFPDYTP